jgi:hypothetical protein
MKQIFAGVISIITVLALVLAITSGIALLSDSSNTDASAVFPTALLIAGIGSVICYRTPATRAWIAAWINPF